MNTKEYKISKYKVNIWKAIAFLYASIEQWNLKFKKQYHLE